MKKILLAALLLIAGFGAEAIAQTPTSPVTGERAQEPRGRTIDDRVERQLEQLTEALNLSEEQAGQVSMILRKTAAKRQSLRGTGDRAANREQARALLGQQDAAIEALLDKKQLKRYQNYKKRRAERGPRGGGRPGGEPPRRDGGK